MTAKIPEPLLLAVLGLVAVVIGCATALAINGTPVPSWFETLATLGFGGALGAYQPSPPKPPAP